MEYKYLYIDDTQDALEAGTINGLQDGNEIKITFKKPNDWETLIVELTKILPDYNGIILDLRLNLIPYEDNKYAQYRGSSVAQELRTLAKESIFKKDFPIILISGDENIQKSLDQTSFDLFDYCVDKNKLEQPNGITYLAFREKLKWLADGYQFLNNSKKTIQDILGIDSDILDSRFIEQFKTFLDKPVHVLARFLTKQVIEKPTFLINENYLAARLGINKNSDDWNNLLEKHINKFIYKGVFSNYFPRWWMHGIDLFWEKEITQEFNLRNTSAAKRVELIIAKTGLTKLSPIEKQDKSKSEAFWLVCKATNVAIDTMDGFIIANQDDFFPWQEKEYVSINEALRPTKLDVWKDVAVLEKNRLQKLKDLYGKGEQRVKQ